MKQNAKLELQIVLAVEELGEATSEEIQQFLGDTYGVRLKTTELMRTIRRIQKKKIICVNIVDGKSAYCIASIPWHSVSDMARVKSVAKSGTTKEAEQLLEAHKEKVEKLILPTSNKYRNFHDFEVTLQSVDNIAGDHSANGEIGTFPKMTGVPYIPTSWWRGWFRSNLYDLNIPETIAKERMTYSQGMVDGKKPAKLVKVSGMTERGSKTYEALPVGTIIKATFRYPMIGTPINSPEKFRKFLERFFQMPKRGLGANPHCFGGRLKVVDFVDLGRTADFLK